MVTLIAAVPAAILVLGVVYQLLKEYGVAKVTV